MTRWRWVVGAWLRSLWRRLVADGDALQIVGGHQTFAPAFATWVDLGVLDLAALFASGTEIMLYDTAAGELISQVRYGTDGWVASDLLFSFDVGPIANGQVLFGILTSGSPSTDLDTFALYDGGFATGPGGGLGSHAQAIAPGPLTLGYVGQVPSGGWVANTAFPVGASIVASAHLWYADITGAGLSGGTLPDFPGAIGTGVVDNDVTWNDAGAIPTVGAIHVYVEVVRTVVP